MPIDEDKLREVEEAVREAGVAFGGEGILGWEGGVVVLVPTDGRIEEWTPIATRAI